MAEPIRGLFHRVKGVVSRQRNGENSGLRIVKEPPNADIDIVAVHGLGGEGFRSWITLDPKAGKSKSWLEELLGKDIPNARIMTYGYISDGVNYRYLVRNVLYGRALDLVKELGAQRLRDHTNRRPVLFIAHSLGGWIVKRALIISSEATESVLKDIELSTCGVAFFGTLSPGRPSSPSPLAHVIRRTTSGLGDDSRGMRAAPSQPLEPQASDIEWLENQMEAFKAITADLPRLSFHETQQSREGFVVEKRHSMAGTDGVQIGLKATHSDLIKFRGRDANYKKFIEKFSEMVDEARTSGLIESKRKVFDLAAVHHLEYLSAGFAISYKLPTEPTLIVPRQDLVDRLEAMLNPQVDPQALHLSIATIWGRAGTGKCTLARHYAEIHEKDISFVFWIRAESWETTVTSYLELANALVTHYSSSAPRAQVENDLGLMGVEDMLKVKSITQLDTLRVKSVVKAVKDWLMRPQNDKWLLVFNHVEPSYDIFDFIPLTLSGKIILTSTDSNCCSWGTKLQVDVMSESQAVELLVAVVGVEAFKDPLQAESARMIAQQLEYHPQKVSLAASTIRKKGLTMSDYYQRKIELKLPLNMLGSTIDQSPVTRIILRISAMLSATIIPVTLFSATSHIGAAPARFSNIFAELKDFQDNGQMDDVLQHLWDQNFIQTPSPTESTSSSQSSSSTTFDYFVLEPAARAHVRSSLTAEEKIDHAWLACNVCVDGIKKKEDDSLTLPEIHDFGRIMAPHAKVCYDDWSSLLERWPDDDDVAWQVLGNVCMTQGAVEQAIGCFELSLKQTGRMDPMDRIQTSLSLASLLQQSGQPKRSREVLTSIDILPSIDKALGFEVAMAKASAAAAEGEYYRAEDQYELLEQEQEDFLGPTDSHTVSTVQKLASTLEHLGKMEEAQALYRRVYLSYRNKFGQSHPMTLDALDDLAHISKESNAIDEAESLYRQSMEIRTRTLGAEHPTTAHALQKLAVIDDVRFRHAEARAKYQRALELMAPTLGRAHPLYTTTMENMALSTRWQGQALGGDGPQQPRDETSNGNSSVRKAAAVLRETRRRRAFEEAERLYLDVLGIKRSARELYSQEDVVESGSKLREMYENETFFAETRGTKIEELLGLLKEGRRRGTF